MNLSSIRNMFPENMIEATFARVQTKNITDRRGNTEKRLVLEPGTNILGNQPFPGMYQNYSQTGIIVFCTGFGVVISYLGEKARIVVDFFIILDAVIMR